MTSGKKSILRVKESWEEFSSACKYHTATECNHNDKLNQVCLDRRYCPRMEATQIRQADIPLWKKDVNEYYRLHDAIFDQLITSKTWQGQQQASLPGIDILASMFKARNEYWRTEKGWAKRKSSKSVELDFIKTYEWAIRQDWNQIKLPKSTMWVE